VDKRESSQLLPGLLIVLGSAVAATVSYWLHIIPIEAGAIGILEALVDIEGRAPDQYRVLPYFIIGLLTKVLAVITTSDESELFIIRFAIMFFGAAFLALSLLLLGRYFARAQSLVFILALLVLFPFLMYGGYRPIASFILLLATALTIILREFDPGKPGMLPTYFLLLGLMCLTRADVRAAEPDPRYTVVVEDSGHSAPADFSIPVKPGDIP